MMWIMEMYDGTVMCSFETQTSVYMTCILKNTVTVY